MSTTLTDVTILTPTECDKMAVSEADNSILFFSSEGSIVQRWSFDSIEHVCLYSKRENKVQIKFVSGQKQLKFNTLPEMEHFFQVTSALAEDKKIVLDYKKIVQPPVRAGPNKVKEVVDKFETLLEKKEPELVVQPPKTQSQQSKLGPSSSSSKVKEQMKAKLNEQLVARMKGPRPPTPKISSIVPNAIRKIWKGLTTKPKQKNITLTVAPILQKSEAPKNEDTFPGTSKSENPKPETSKVVTPKSPQSQAAKVTFPTPTSALQPKPNAQIEVVDKKVKSELYRLVEQAMEKEIKAMQQHEPNKPKIVGVTFKD